MSTHEEIKADLSLFVLGSLTAEEMEEIRQHLADGCAECEAEIARWDEVAGMLPFGVDVQAPADLRAQLLARIAGRDEGVSPFAAGGKVVPLRRRSWLAPALAVAALALLALGVTRELSLRSELDEQVRATTGLRAALNIANTNSAQGEAELKRVRDQLAERENDANGLRTALTAAEESLAMIQRPGLELVRLKETPDAKPAQGHVLISPSGKALFYAFDLAPLPADKVYELWWITEKEGPVNAGLFELDASGMGRVESAMPTEVGKIKAAAVTIEPSGGVPKPTGPMVLLGNV